MGFSADAVRLGPRDAEVLGANDQLVSVEKAVLAEGSGRGEPVLLVRNPGGVSFEILLDRGMDIGWADALGSPLAWRSPRGRVASTGIAPTGFGWSETFGGGLLSTCGLASVGAPSEVDGVRYGLHGRVGHTPAEHVRWSLTDSSYGAAVVVTGEVVESALGHPTLRLIRRITASCSRPVVLVEDTVLNESHSRAGHMFRHHLNLGYPLVDHGTLVDADAEFFGWRDRAGVPPSPPLRMVVAESMKPETVAYARSGARGVVTVASALPSALSVTVSYSSPTFPMLVLWRDESPGVNVLGVEPSTCRDGGRAEAERLGEIVWLDPGQRRSYSTEVEVSRS